MNLVDDDTSNKEPESIGSPAARQGVSSPGEPNLSGFFSPGNSDTAKQDAVPGAQGNGDSLTRETGSASMCATEQPSQTGDKMAGMKHIA